MRQVVAHPLMTPAGLRRHALPWLLLAAFAQLLQPLLHERLMPRHRGLADVFCGLVSNASLRQFAQQAPAELLALIGQRQRDAQHSLACEACSCAQATQPALPSVWMSALRLPRVPAWFVAMPALAFLRALPVARARGPPIVVSL